MSGAAAAPAEAQLEWEKRAGKLAGASAVLAALLALAALPLRAGLVSGRELDEQLLSIQGDEVRYLAAQVIDALSAIVLLGVVIYLYRCTKARRPELVSAAWVLGVVGSVAYAASRIGSALVFIDLSDEFASLRVPERVAEERAEDLARDSSAEVFSFIGLGGVLALGFSLLLLSLNAMRAGLVSRFMGILGIVLAVLFVLGGGPPPVLYAFWLAALGALFLNRWPGGRGPAWETGEAIPWPSAADAARRAEQAAPASGEDRPDEAPEPVARKRSRKKRR